MKYEEKTLEKHYVYQGKILNLRRDEVSLPDGTPTIREIVEHLGGAAVVAKTQNGIAFVRQFRYAYGEEIYEIPAGKLNAGEDPKEAARRELSEETGLIAEELKLLTVIYPSPGYTQEKLYVYEAQGLTQGKEHLDEGEFLDVLYLSEEEALRRIESGEIRDAKTVIGILMCCK